MKQQLTAAAMLAAPIALAQPAHAAPGDPVQVGDGFSIDPIIDLRLRYEGVDTPALGADAVTLRVRAGAELRHASGLAVLTETESTLALDKRYNAFPFPIADSQRRPGHAVVADPENVELNRLQLQYRTKALSVTLGRQRINLDDQRFVGSAFWRQNEQTFDAVRTEARLGPLSLDGTYAISQRTGLGVEAGPRTAYDGRFVFLGAGGKLGPVQLKAFGYLLDYDPAAQVGALAVSNADTQTYGLRAVTSLPVHRGVKLNLAASYARQSAWKDNPASYAATYAAAEAGLAGSRLGVNAGYERLGADRGHAFQTPMATLHKFNGWADLFLTTPASGLQDFYAGANYRLTGIKALPGLNAGVTFHRFESDVGSQHYGDEWDASAGFRLGRANLLAKYANYRADRFGGGTRKLWLQLELAY